VPVPEAPFRSTRFGLVADVEGWFVLNARDSRWRDYGAGVERETTKPDDAYARFPRSVRTTYRDGWLPDL
jgi:hypothetical protein